jgi:hypothetical protein
MMLALTLLSIVISILLVYRGMRAIYDLGFRHGLQRGRLGFRRIPNMPSRPWAPARDAPIVGQPADMSGWERNPDD